MKTLAKQLEQEKKKRKIAEKDMERWKHLAEVRANTNEVLQRDARINEASIKMAETLISYLVLQTENERCVIPKDDMYKMLDKKTAVCEFNEKDIAITIKDV